MENEKELCYTVKNVFVREYGRNGSVRAFKHGKSKR